MLRTIVLNIAYKCPQYCVQLYLMLRTIYVYYNVMKYIHYSNIFVWNKYGS